MWLSESVHSAFIDACKLSGRKTCDVIEPFERAYVEIVKKSVLEDKIEPCPFHNVNVNLVLNLTTKYNVPRPKPEDKHLPTGYIFCPKAQTAYDMIRCFQSCRYGKKHEIYQSEPCKAFFDR